jgi:hypothetical protein
MRQALFCRSAEARRCGGCPLRYFEAVADQILKKLHEMQLSGSGRSRKDGAGRHIFDNYALAPFKGAPACCFPVIDAVEEI